MIELFYGFFSYLLPFLVVLTILVFFHELGHYFFARINGVKVNDFAIGFGPEIFGFTDKKGTRWKVCWLPFGGYVNMAGFELEDDADNSLKNDKTSYFSKTPLQKISIVLGGPVANFVLAIILLFFLFFIYGERQSAPIIGYAEQNDSVKIVNLLPGDQIVEFNGKKIQNFRDIQLAFQFNLQDENEIELIRDGRSLKAFIPLSPEEKSQILSEDFQKQLKPFLQTILSHVEPNSPADKAGLRKGDEILALNNKNVKDFREVQKNLIGLPQKQIDLLILRDGQEKVVQVNTGIRELSNGETIGYLGVRPTTSTVLIKKGFGEAAIGAVEKTWSMSVMTIQAIYQMVTGVRSTDELGGPIRIAQLSKQVVELGAVTFILYLALFSINLGIFNLLPVPLLDGGHFLFHLYELITGRKVNPKVVNLLLQIGIILILFLFLFTTFKDIMRFEGFSSLVKNLIQ